MKNIIVVEMKKKSNGKKKKYIGKKKRADKINIKNSKKKDDKNCSIPYPLKRFVPCHLGHFELLYALFVVT